jgi:hypothetical protein
MSLTYGTASGSDRIIFDLSFDIFHLSSMDLVVSCFESSEQKTHDRNHSMKSPLSENDKMKNVK